MNTTLKIETIALREIVPFFLRICFLALLSAVSVCVAQTPTRTTDAQTELQTSATDLAEAEPAPTIPPQQLESLVAPIALYPDPILVQVLAASTYPLEIVQLKQWLDESKGLKGKALVDAVAAQDWDPSVQALAAFPGVVDKLANNIRWTTDLGNAFLAQESDVMDSVQTLRAKAQANGALKTNDKQTVGTETTNDGKEAITIESARRDVVYVPSYNTQYVYRDSDSSSYSNSSGYSGYSGDSGYSDSGYSYLGYAVAAAYGYYWGRYNWRDGYPETNYDNYYNYRYNQKWNNKINNWSNKTNNFNGRDFGKYADRATQGTGRWQHDPIHRGNAPYGNQNLAQRFGQANNRLAGSRFANQPSQLSNAAARSQLSRANANLPRPNSGGMPRDLAGARSLPNHVGNHVPSNWPNGARGGTFGPSNGNLARAFSGRGAQSMAPSRMGPPQGLRAGGPPGGGFHGGPPGGGLHGGPPMGGGLPPGGPPMGGAPPPPPPPPPP